MKVKRFLVLTLIAAIAGMTLAFVAMAATTIVVTPPVNSQGWSTNDTTAGGTVDFVVDSTAPAGVGALQLTTDASTTAKAQYFHATNTPLANVTELSYYTRQVSAPFVGADPAYQLITFLNGGTAGFTTLVFEPYQNPQLGPVVNNIWQSWDVDSGLFWSTRTVTCSNGVIAGTAGGPATYTLDAIRTICPNAVVAAFGVNIGSNNPSYNVYTDLVNFNGTSYDFEPYLVASSKDQCKNGGYANVKRADGSSFKNQGDCIQYLNTGN